PDPDIGNLKEIHPVDCLRSSVVSSRGDVSLLVSTILQMEHLLFFSLGTLQRPPPRPGHQYQAPILLCQIYGEFSFPQNGSFLDEKEIPPFGHRRNLRYTQTKAET